MKLSLYFYGRFLTFGATDFGGWVILCCGGLSVPCRMFSKIPALTDLDQRLTQCGMPFWVVTKRNPPASV